MKKILNIAILLLISAYSNAGVFLEIGVSNNDKDIDSLSFLNPVGTGFTTNTTSGDYINLDSLNQNTEDDGRFIKIGMDYSGFDIYIVQKSFGTSEATGTATFGGFPFTQRLMLDVDVLALGISYPFDLGNNHSLAPTIELGKADIDASGQQISPSGTFNSFPNNNNDESSLAFGVTYAYAMTQNVDFTASYMVNDLGDANTDVTGGNIAGMNAGEQLQSEVEISEFTIGMRINL